MTHSVLGMSKRCHLTVTWTSPCDPQQNTVPCRDVGCSSWDIALAMYLTAVTLGGWP